MVSSFASRITRFREPPHDTGERAQIKSFWAIRVNRLTQRLRCLLPLNVRSSNGARAISTASCTSHAQTPTTQDSGENSRLFGTN